MQPGWQTIKIYATFLWQKLTLGVEIRKQNHVPNNPGYKGYMLSKDQTGTVTTRQLTL